MYNTEIVICTNCRGEGRAKVEDPHNYYGSLMGECPACKGSGKQIKVEAVVFVPYTADYKDKYSDLAYNAANDFEKTSKK
jgi:excinuclease UvrABC ATPase subunit